MIFLIAHIITAVLVALKLAGVIMTPWLICFAPSLIAITVAVLLVLAAACLCIAMKEKLTKRYRTLK
ncbi:hypothetical protein [Geobacter sp. SVR]|uniref:hypothetical protein n=1 Tax=Geobacter sp. SVR TaxID=2495594 RepID=UPI00143EFF1F|nr:hypothetical protein [Geobacter sp. SVR]BCS53322.1 hypothetical protein GSVR_16300 [Geobacter sp. SVR]GCF85552.1 hypothetical protein GSbR_21520 [Geobacter sp. SVR]